MWRFYRAYTLNRTVAYPTQAIAARGISLRGVPYTVLWWIATSETIACCRTAALVVASYNRRNAVKRLSNWVRMEILSFGFSYCRAKFCILINSLLSTKAFETQYLPEVAKYILTIRPTSHQWCVCVEKIFQRRGKYFITILAMKGYSARPLRRKVQVRITNKKVTE